MSHKQSWSLSQGANKSSGICSCCRATGQLHLKDGTMHQHGPRKNRCPGSNKPPLSTAPHPLAPTFSQASLPASAPVSVSASSSSPASTPASSSTPSSTAISSAGVALPRFAHPWLNAPTIKHIPKSARPACGNLLSKSLDKIIAKPDEISSWSSLLNFGKQILLQPARTGKRHNLASIIKKRTNVDEQEPDDEQPGHRGFQKKRDPAAQLAAAIMAKVEDGNI